MIRSTCTRNLKRVQRRLVSRQKTSVNLRDLNTKPETLKAYRALVRKATTVQARLEKKRLLVEAAIEGLDCLARVKEPFLTAVRLAKGLEQELTTAEMEQGFVDAARRGKAGTWYLGSLDRKIKKARGMIEGPFKKALDLSRNQQRQTEKREQARLDPKPFWRRLNGVHRLSLDALEDLACDLMALESAFWTADGDQRQSDFLRLVPSKRERLEGWLTKILDRIETNYQPPFNARKGQYLSLYVEILSKLVLIHCSYILLHNLALEPERLTASQLSFETQQRMRTLLSEVRKDLRAFDRQLEQGRFDDVREDLVDQVLEALTDLGFYLEITLKENTQAFAKAG